MKRFVLVHSSKSAVDDGGVAEEADEAVDATGADDNDPKKPHGRSWETVENQGFDPTLSRQYCGDTTIKYGEAVAHTALHERNPLQYFETFFPQDSVSQTLKATNEVMVNKDITTPLSKGEYYKWLGIQLTMAVQPVRGGVDAYWSDGREEESCFLGPGLGKWSGMSKNRYLNIRGSLCFKEKMEERSTAAVCVAHSHCRSSNLCINSRPHPPFLSSGPMV